MIAVGAYGLDRVLRFVKTRYAYAYLTPIPDLGMTKVEIPVLNAGCLTTSMGWFGWAEAHPFSIASVSKVRFNDLVTCFKARR